MGLWVPFIMYWVDLLTLEGLVVSYLDLARSRYSCRLFEDRPVEQSVVDRQQKPPRFQSISQSSNGDT